MKVCFNKISLVKNILLENKALWITNQHISNINNESKGYRHVCN